MIARLFVHLLPIELGLLNFLLTGKPKQHKDLTKSRLIYNVRVKQAAVPYEVARVLAYSYIGLVCTEFWGGKKAHKKESVVCFGE